MIVMMWPALTKVRYEELPRLTLTRRLWEQLALSLFLNWIIGPFVSVFEDRRRADSDADV